MNDVILVTKKSMGNGVIDDITDVIFVEPSKFDNMQTEKWREKLRA